MPPSNDHSELPKSPERREALRILATSVVAVGAATLIPSVIVSAESERYSTEEYNNMIKVLDNLTPEIVDREDFKNSFLSMITSSTSLYLDDICKQYSTVKPNTEDASIALYKVLRDTFLIREYTRRQTLLSNNRAEESYKDILNLSKFILATGLIKQKYTDGKTFLRDELGDVKPTEKLSDALVTKSAIQTLRINLGPNGYRWPELLRGEGKASNVITQILANLSISDFTRLIDPSIYRQYNLRSNSFERENPQDQNSRPKVMNMDEMDFPQKQKEEILNELKKLNLDRAVELYAPRLIEQFCGAYSYGQVSGYCIQPDDYENDRDYFYVVLAHELSHSLAERGSNLADFGQRLDLRERRLQISSELNPLVKDFFLSPFGKKQTGDISNEIFYNYFYNILLKGIEGKPDVDTLTLLAGEFLTASEKMKPEFLQLTMGSSETIDSYFERVSKISTDEPLLKLLINNIIANREDIKSRNIKISGLSDSDISYLNGVCLPLILCRTLLYQDGRMRKADGKNHWDNYVNNLKQRMTVFIQDYALDELVAVGFSYHIYSKRTGKKVAQVENVKDKFDQYIQQLLTYKIATSETPTSA